MLCLLLRCFPAFLAGLDVLIRCLSTSTHSLSNQTFCWNNATPQIVDALLDEYHWRYLWSLELQAFCYLVRNDYHCNTAATLIFSCDCFEIHETLSKNCAFQLRFCFVERYASVGTRPSSNLRKLQNARQGYFLEICSGATKVSSNLIILVEVTPTC